MKYLALLVLLASCTGIQLRDNVLMPAAVLVYEILHIQIDEGIADAVVDGDLTQDEAIRLRALASQLGVDLARGDRAALSATAWAALSVFAERAIDEWVAKGDIPAGVGELLKQRVTVFGETLLTLMERTN